MEPPSFGETCPTSRSVVAEKGITSAVVTWAPVKVTDNHRANLTVFPAVSPPHLFSEGIHAVVYTAKDPSGNIKQCSFRITVQGKKKQRKFAQGYTFSCCSLLLQMRCEHTYKGFKGSRSQCNKTFSKTFRRETGLGLWKLNNAVVDDEEYVNHIKNIYISTGEKKNKTCLITD